MQNIELGNTGTEISIRPGGPRWQPVVRKAKGDGIDYEKNKGIPIPLMKKQCETGLRWIQEGKIDGMIFLANTTMDIGLESVEWTRNWIKEVGDTPITRK